MGESCAARIDHHARWYWAAEPTGYGLSFDGLSATVGPMKIFSVMGKAYLGLILLSAVVGACSMSDTGLGPMPDAGPPSGTAICPAGLTDRANWPANTTYTSCTKTCGPDGIGIRSCSQIDRTTCQATSGCVCLESPCVACGNCAFLTISECYVPTNAASVPACATGVSQGVACSPACGKQLCMEADGKTGCVCNAQRQYACATWGETAWK